MPLTPEQRLALSRAARYIEEQHKVDYYNNQDAQLAAKLHFEAVLNAVEDDRPLPRPSPQVSRLPA